MDGRVSKFALPYGDDAVGITAGTDGALWFTDWRGNKIGRLSVRGDYKYFPIPTPSSGPSGIASAQDGTIWFAESQADKIGRLKP